MKESGGHDLPSFASFCSMSPEEKEKLSSKLVIAMELLDFPPETFRRMIDCLVSDAGVVESWKLRSVCRRKPIFPFAYMRSTDFLGTFDQEISENVLGIQPQSAFYTFRALCILLRPGTMKHYLAYHVKNPRDVSPELPARIQKMVKYIIKELGTDHKQQDRNVLLEICTGLAITCRDISGLLWNSELYTFSNQWSQLGKVWYEEQRKSPGQDLDMHEKLTAAMSIRDHGLVVKLLSDAPEHLPQSVWEQPITAAVQLEDPEMITLMLNVLDHHKSKKFKRNQMLENDSTYSILIGVSKSITNNRDDITLLLLGYFRGYTALLNKTCYREWIELAIHRQNDKSLEYLLQMAPTASPFRISNKIFEQGCRNGSSTIINTLLEHGQVQLDSTSNTLSALAASIRSGTVEIVREVVTAGADINYAMSTHRIAKRPTITPLEYAIYVRNHDVVTYLVQCGAKIPPKSIWPSRGEMQKTLQKGVEERRNKA
ncbi:hypothetical protein G6011_09302 [Alternaria panax]|uniref:Ankyrin repeat protein n=1 Tax=Alternaria panax TaxID=48097 RepID=A0AAD4NPS6_9PLEO|nr:hypothetical protein G6011_09302 [Alternaria panax]